MSKPDIFETLHDFVDKADSGLDTATVLFWLKPLKSTLAVFAKLYDADTGVLLISATLEYIAKAIEKRGYRLIKVEGEIL